MSALITFATLFIGLIHGPMTVEVVVSPPIAAVRVSLDDEVVAERERPPWTFEVDFGRPMPHRLDAVGLDAEGAEVGRATQWVNLPRSPAELEIALLREQDGRVRAARLIWALVRASEPRAISVSLDGRPLPVSDPARVELPAVDEVAYDGSRRGATGRELTAVPLRLAHGSGLPTPASLTGALSASGKPVEVVAVERPSARVVLVVDARAVEALLKIGAPPQPGPDRPVAAHGARSKTSRRSSTSRRRAGRCRIACAASSWCGWTAPIYHRTSRWPEGLRGSRSRSDPRARWQSSLLRSMTGGRATRCQARDRRDSSRPRRASKPGGLVIAGSCRTCLGHNGPCPTPRTKGGLHPRCETPNV